MQSFYQCTVTHMRILQVWPPTLDFMQGFYQCTVTHMRILQVWLTDGATLTTEC